MFAVFLDALPESSATMTFKAIAIAGHVIPRSISARGSFNTTRLHHGWGEKGDPETDEFRRKGLMDAQTILGAHQLHRIARNPLV